MIRKVTPKSFTGWNMSLAQLWGSGPKLTIQCGECELEFKQRVQMTDNPAAICPFCKVVNVLPIRIAG